MARQTPGQGRCLVPLDKPHMTGVMDWYGRMTHRPGFAAIADNVR